MADGFKLFDGWTQEDIAAWLDKHGEPEGCKDCGAIAGHCGLYPNCYGNPDWKPPTQSGLRFWLWDAAFYWKRFRVCVLCYWYLRHWPWGDLSTAEWRFTLDGEAARSAFIEGWCRE